MANEVIDVGGAVSEEERAIVGTDSGILTSFLVGVGTFLETARSLEGRAGELEAQAKAFTAPASAADDAALQRFVQTANEAKRAIVAHWEIAGVFHRFHKRLVAFRERGASRAEAAATVAQRLHNAYVDAERRRVAEENARLQQEAEAAAEARRESEAADREREALALEAGLDKLSERESTFLALFLAGTPAAQAAKRAGYKDAAGQASRLLAAPKMIQAIQAAQSAATLRKQAEAERARPLDVAPVAAVTAAIEKAGSDRTTWRGDVVDEAKFVAAVVAGKHGIPLELLTVNQAELTKYARSLHENLNRWPGVRAVKSTTTI